MTESILLSDYAGHPFTTELAATLASRGETITYTYCAATVSPKGCGHDDIDIVRVSEGLTFEKYRPLPRLWSEIRYGAATARVVWAKRPDVHVVCNMPLVSAALVWFLSLPLRVRFIVWFQDVQSGLATASLGSVAGRALSMIETFVLRRAATVIAISPELADEAIRRGVERARVGFMENWAPIEQLPLLDRHTRWADENGLTAEPLFVYAGTLARKHDPSLLIDLATSIESVGGQVVVVTEGEGAEFIETAIRNNEAPANITLLPYQPFDRLPEVLASADVLVVVLEPDAGRFSVPSKTLSYLCAGRAVLASMPTSNAAARLLTERAQAGLVADPSDRDRFCSFALQLAADASQRQRLGTAGRQYAEKHFTQDIVVEGFLSQLLGRGR